MRPTLAAWLLLVSALLATREAAADSCTVPDLVEARPADKAINVPTNASLHARYPSTADYAGEPVVLQRVGEGERTVFATWTAAEGILRIVPPEPLVAGQSYVVRWPALRGLNAANKGRGLDVHFTVGTAADKAPPSFAGPTAIAWDVENARDDCTDAMEQRFLFDLALGDASDDGGRENLELVVFQTAGPGIDPKAPLPVLVQTLPAVGQRARVVRTTDRATGHVCFAAVVRDLTGQVSSGAAERCVDTVAPPFFTGCAGRLAAGDDVHGASAALVLAGLLSVAHRSRSRRRPR